jgi:hypothetical protein
VTHPDPADAVATIQSQQAAWIVTARIGSTPTNVGADLNMENAPGWVNFGSSSAGLATAPAAGPIEGIDYLLASVFGHLATGWRNRHCDSTKSDHCLLSGRHIS